MEMRKMRYRIPLVFATQPEGGYTVTSPLLPELITEGDSVDDAIDNVRDALATVIEAYGETGRTLPLGLFALDQNQPISAEMVVTVQHHGRS